MYSLKMMKVPLLLFLVALLLVEQHTEAFPAVVGGKKNAVLRQSTHLFGLADDIQRKVRRGPVRTGKEVDHTDASAVSASLYLNPAAEKIAPHVVVTWEPAAAKTIATLAQIRNPRRPLMVGVVGIPGSGKSTSCDILASCIAEEFEALVMPMDGYHFSLAELEKFENASDAIYRRGACDTFDPDSLARDLERIAHGKEASVKIPGFDHARGDPEPDQHVFERSKHDIVIAEGLYLLHDKDGWEHIQKFLDWTIYIESDVDECVARLKERNKCIPGYTPQEIEIRCDRVDRVNALLAHETASKYASQVVQSGAIFTTAEVTEAEGSDTVELVSAEDSLRGEVDIDVDKVGASH